jgi:hypothetical protein
MQVGIGEKVALQAFRSEPPNDCLRLLYDARRALYIVETTFSSKFESYRAHHLYAHHLFNILPARQLVITSNLTLDRKTEDSLRS